MLMLCLEDAAQLSALTRYPPLFNRPGRSLLQTQN
jgi:hypothetical protein